jgi:hypothetical protein
MRKKIWSAENRAAALAARRAMPKESTADSPLVFAVLNAHWRVIVCRDGLQWILQESASSSRGWRRNSYCQTRRALVRCIAERALAGKYESCKDLVQRRHPHLELTLEDSEETREKKAEEKNWKIIRVADMLDEHALAVIAALPDHIRDWKSA